MKIINIGRGATYHRDEINLDLFGSTDVRIHNIKKIGCSGDDFLDVIYHSHLLEKFSLTRPGNKKFNKKLVKIFLLRPIVKISFCWSGTS